MKRMHLLAAAAAATITFAGASTAGRLSDSQLLSIYGDHAGAPVPKFRLFGHITRWQPLGDEAIAVWTKPGEAWLLDFTGPCQDVDYAVSIGLTSTTGMVYAKLDKVLVRSRSVVNLPCFIARIRPLDLKALKQAESDARAQPSGT